jgi:hypothetical protein
VFTKWPSLPYIVSFSTHRWGGSFREMEVSFDLVRLPDELHSSVAERSKVMKLSRASLPPPISARIHKCSF